MGSAAQRFRSDRVHGCIPWMVGIGATLVGAAVVASAVTQTVVGLIAVPFFGFFVLAGILGWATMRSRVAVYTDYVEVPASGYGMAFMGSGQNVYHYSVRKKLPMVRARLDNIRAARVVTPEDQDEILVQRAARLPLMFHAGGNPTVSGPPEEQNRMIAERLVWASCRWLVKDVNRAVAIEFGPLHPVLQPLAGPRPPIDGLVLYVSVNDPEALAALLDPRT